jgi:prepilin-type N-terminal cleavage/methylation domain-containing protein
MPGPRPSFPPEASAQAPLQPRSAFTLVELLTVIAIIALLSTLALKAVQTVRRNADKLRCAASLR